MAGNEGSAAKGEIRIGHVQIIRGREAILSKGDLLLRFAERCDQAGAMEDMGYFLSKPGFWKRRPQLMLIAASEEISEDTLLGVLLVYEYRVMGVGMGMYTTNDRSGRNTLIAPTGRRSQMARVALEELVKRGAHLAVITFRGEADEVIDPAGDQTKRVPTLWASRDRTTAEYLPLQKTFDATLAKIGQRTRSNMRYARRRAEAQLGCTFVPSLEISKAEFLAFNRECMFAVPQGVASWRYDTLKDLAQPLLMGMRDKDGRWLSMVGGRRFNAGSELLWQMNRDGLLVYSLSLVMRSYFIEQEIGHGSLRFYIEGGTTHPIYHSFTTETLTDLAVMRTSMVSFLARKIAQHMVPEDNELAKMISDQTLSWRSSSRS